LLEGFQVELKDFVHEGLQVPLLCDAGLRLASTDLALKPTLCRPYATQGQSPVTPTKDFSRSAALHLTVHAG
jgi:hypothetical protein